MVVLDSSAVIDLLLDVAPHATPLAERVRRESPQLLTLHLLDAEVGQVLRRYVLRGLLAASRAMAALDDLADLPLIRYPHLPLAQRAFELRANATFYDALYVALAEGTRAPLLTRDAAFAAIPGHRAAIEVVA